MKKLLLAIAGAGIATLGVGAVNRAEAITFNFSGNQAFQDSFEFTADGATVTATGTNQDGDDALTTRNPFGLGVLQQDGENNRLDGEGDFDILELSFDRPFVLGSATFARIVPDDQFSVSVDGNQLFSGDVPENMVFDFTQFELSARTGSMIAFTVVDSSDGFRVQELNADEVPEPLTILGSATALGFGALFKRAYSKRKQAQG